MKTHSTDTPQEKGSHTYFEIEITANSSGTEIWLGDDEGHLVQKEVGVLRSSLLPGDYVVEFGLGTGCYPSSTHDPVRLSEQVGTRPKNLA